ncbi:MAG: nuclear transport factor 2 family protein [Brevundimonas sp.]|uniref:nuclear transport factor 2 family protein n=1 Tax=Brevundimonas sp. TaxID=1871086 RepID=UPI00262B3ECD|nr:nuclear transport factor 2 family protein [Brevundimonas sp.]MDI6623196.1 nuclear transport factor 2 family protein [Brevundimonas sp.]MDQ7811347.1 nuclear transport factor 2 family protein [Brevundimonas sp.]
MTRQEDDNDIWNLEERLWIEGPETWARLVHPNGVIAFTEPVGVLAEQQAGAGRLSAPRWASVHIVEQDIGWIDEDLVVLAYVGEGRRPGAPSCRALCTSTWRRDDGRWRLVQHQQTPLGVSKALN